MSDRDILKLMEPITRENLHELKPGEWIWDDRLIERREHKRSLGSEKVIERTGFRQVHILEKHDRWNTKPLMLSSPDKGYCVWEYFNEGRFYRFKKPAQKVKVRKKKNAVCQECLKRAKEDCIRALKESGDLWTRALDAWRKAAK